jgi:hypothetical protein
MLKFFQIALLGLFVAMLAGCTVQKRTLMPGYHVEWGGEHHLMETTDAPAEKLTSLKTTPFEQIPAQSLAVGVSPILKRDHIPKQIAALPRIAPKAMLVSPAQDELQDPTPWARAYEAQKKFGNTALGAFGLAVLLQTTGAPQAALVMALVVGTIAFFLNRRKRREVLDLKELNGYDVTEERRQFRTGNRLLGGAVFATVIAYIGLAIVTVLAFIAFIEAIFSW